MDRSKNYSLLLLAGGKSSRMGRNKAELLFEGKTFLDSLIYKAKNLGIVNIYVSGHGDEKEGISIIGDIYPDRGPLGGIHACMSSMDTPYCLILPVDVPQIPTTVLEELLEFHRVNRHIPGNARLPLILEHDDRKEYLIGIYPVKMQGYIEEKIKEHSVSVHRMLEEYGYERYQVNIPAWQVSNINTMEDYRELLIHK